MSGIEIVLLVSAAFMLSTNAQQISLSKEDKLELLNAHNYLRGIVNPIATNMEQMVWSDELAGVAQNYADRCIFLHNGDRSDQSPSFTYVGENLYASTSPTVNYTEAVVSWYNEVADFTYQSNSCRQGAVCGHYTQVVWATSSNVGCGAQRCASLQNTGFSNALIVVCNYGPGGNFNNLIPYLTGAESCSACPQDKPYCSANLCSSTAPATDTPTQPQTDTPTQPQTDSPTQPQTDGQSNPTQPPSDAPTTLPGSATSPVTVMALLVVAGLTAATLSF